MIITIARQCGCGAVNVGRLLAEHYGIPFYTRQNLKEMAAQKGLKDKLDDFFDERPVDELLFSISSYGDERKHVTEKPLRMLADMLANEDCIIIGRCGNYIFRHRKDLVSVFLGGAMDARVASIASEEHLSMQSARDFVEHIDDCRSVYHKYYTGLTWGNAADYDMCIDSMRIGAANTAEIIQDYIRRVGVSKAGR